jgi:hypothetical protein
VTRNLARGSAPGRPRGRGGAWKTVVFTVQSSGDNVVDGNRRTTETSIGARK